MARRNDEEHQEQVKFVRWFRLQFPGVRIMAIPNGGDRNAIVAAKLKAEGVCRGVPDLFVPEWRLWIEMKKRKGGRLTTDQKDWLEYLKANGYVAERCNGFDEARALVMGRAA